MYRFLQEQHMNRRVSAALAGVAFLIVGSLALIRLSPLRGDAEGSPFAEAPSPTFDPGDEAVPQDLLARAKEEFNSYICNKGGLDNVTASGATTFGEIDALLPKLAIGKASPNIPGSNPVFGVVVQGQCTAINENPYETKQGYFLFDGEGRLIYGRVWVSGSEPRLDEAFGPEVDNGLAMG
jgi:hypothetical protein